MHDATTDAGKIRAWWRRSPDSNVGVATGIASGLLVIDIDPRHGGDDTLEALERELGALPETPAVETGGGGVHYFFASPARDEEFRSTLGAGVDVKHSGGYVVAPPSAHASGQGYAWRAECHPDELPLGDLPEQWLAALRRPAGEAASTDPMPDCDVPLAVRDDRARRYVARMPIAISDQGGHRALWSVAVVVVRGMMLPPDRAMAILRDYSERCQPPWSERELRHKLEDAMRARVPWGYLLVARDGDAAARPRAHVPLPTAENERSDGRHPAAVPAKAMSATAPWETPIPLDRPHARTRIPITEWPEWVREYVRALAAAYQVPRELPAMLALGALAGSVARKFSLRIRPDWIEALALWCVVALPPSERKSPPVERIRAPILAHEEKRNAEVAPLIRDGEAKRDLLIERVKHFRQKAAKAVGDARDQAEQELRNSEADLAAVVVPTAVVEMVDDITVERLATLMVENGERMLILSDEGGIWDTIAGRYAGDHASANLDLWLRGYSGSEHRVHRGSRPPDYLRRPAISMAITVQPIVLERLAARDGFVGRGVVARPLYSVPHPMAGYRGKGDPPPVLPEQERTWARRLRNLYEIATPKDSTELTLTATARRKFVAWCDELEPRRRPDGDLGGVLGEWAGKLPGQIARTAAVLHCARYASGAIPTEVAIDEVAAAIEMADYLIDHARVALGMMGADPAAADARRVLHAAAPYAGKAVRRGVLHRATRLDRRRLDEAVRVLVEYGWLRPVAPDGGGQAGRPATVYQIHPATDPGRESPLGVSGLNGVNGHRDHDGGDFEPIKPETPYGDVGETAPDDPTDEAVA